ncbi:YchJ family protein [Pseudodesulfovibrio tunisiensis]|uniref:YchJ family protein n=1 Tax=Pseudodesulfovibrio tunisiensis TaxID=463192 RepID=UPI001FB40A5C|nr:YchJ family protein [Pseudodesulfovibrio tunisiensis]
MNLTIEETIMSEMCPCGSGKSLAECCGPYLNQEAQAPTAEALMRARYSAYVTRQLDYLRHSLAPELQESHDEDAVREWADSAKWLGLQILDTIGGSAAEDQGVVEFAASYEQDGAAMIHRERSRFRRDEGIWYYVDGEAIAGPPVRRETPKIGRNEPCPCGSGRKYKKCCGR